MNCNLCNKLLTSDTIKYKCGHAFHKFCLLPKNISIINPECKFCNNGKMEGYPSEDEYFDEDFDEDEDLDEDEDKDLTKHEKIILCEFVLLGLSLIGVIAGLIYK